MVGWSFRMPRAPAPARSKTAPGEAGLLRQLRVHHQPFSVVPDCRQPDAGARDQGDARGLRWLQHAAVGPRHRACGDNAVVELRGVREDLDRVANVDLVEVLKDVAGT